MSEVDVVHLAAWLDVDDNWLKHVIDYNFSCGCRLVDSEYGRAAEECAIWLAGQAKIKAEEDLARATASYEKAKEANKSIEIGRR